jgi:uncharacterized membrane protein YhhN
MPSEETSARPELAPLSSLVNVGRVAALVGLLAAAGFFVALAVDAVSITRILKPIPVIALAAWMTLSRPDRAARVVVFGLIVSAVGDVLMDVKGAFVPGMAAFAAAHIAYIVANVMGHRRLSPALALPFLAWGVGLVLYVRAGVGSLALPVGVYAVILCSMMWRAAARYAEDRRKDTRTGLIGALFFGLSDSLIAIQLSGVDFPEMRVLIMVSYWAGQTGIAASFVEASRRAAPSP